MNRLLALILCVTLLLCGCNSTTADIDAVATTITADIFHSPSTELIAVAMPAMTEHFYFAEETELFYRSFQDFKLIFPNSEVSEKILTDFRDRLTQVDGDAENVLAAAQEDYEQQELWYPYFHQMLYSPTRIDSGILSLFGIYNSYSGGLHGRVICIGLNYDLRTGDRLSLGSIIAAHASTDTLIDMLLQRLAQQQDILFENYEEIVREYFSKDVTLYEDFYLTETGLNFYFSPYEIAPYSAGVINAELSYTALTEILHSVYLPQSANYRGKLKWASFQDTDMEQFQTMNQINLAEDGSLLVLYPDDSIGDIRITLNVDNASQQEYIAFAAMTLTAKDALVLKVSEKQMENIRITYNSDGRIVTESLTD